jgi:hypothetical protein
VVDGLANRKSWIANFASASSPAREDVFERSLSFHDVSSETHLSRSGSTVNCESRDNEFKKTAAENPLSNNQPNRTCGPGNF